MRIRWGELRCRNANDATHCFRRQGHCAHRVARISNNISFAFAVRISSNRQTINLGRDPLRHLLQECTWAMAICCTGMQS